MKRPEEMSNEELDKYIDDQLFMKSLEKKRVPMIEQPCISCSVDELLRTYRNCLVEKDKMDKRLNEIIKLKDEIHGLFGR